MFSEIESCDMRILEFSTHLRDHDLIETSGHGDETVSLSELLESLTLGLLSVVIDADSTLADHVDITQDHSDVALTALERLLADGSLYSAVGFHGFLSIFVPRHVG